MSTRGKPLTETQKAKMRVHSAALRQSPAYRARQKENQLRWYAKPENREKMRKYGVAYGPAYRAKPENKKRVCEYHKRKRRTDPHFNIACTMRTRIGTVLRSTRNAKCAGTLALVGCDAAFLRAYIEARFLPGMSWAERSKWHVDHIRPCASFDLSDPAQQRECFHYSNLQPLWKLDNLRKCDKLL